MHRVPPQIPIVKIPSWHVEGVHPAKLGSTVLVHELPDGSSDVQSPRSSALGSSVEASQFAGIKI